ncbi:MAG: NUDIX hydrolase [Proteobacteria bacterium]|nr:NUDIX hydrolase [Pseudomonadota bacterium]
MLERWKLLAREPVYANPPWLMLFSDTIELPDGKRLSGWHHIQLLDFSGIVARREDGKFILIRQYKHGVGEVSLTLPGGALGDGEAPLAAAKRELLEETGHAAERWTPLINLITHANQRCSAGHMFYAENARPVAKPDSGDLEEMVLEYLSEAEIRQALLRNEVKLGSSIAALGMVLAGLIPERS